MIIHNVDQNTPEWYALRAGIPTASCFSKLVTSKGDSSKSAEDYVRTLAAERYAGGEVDHWEGNRHTDRGHELEPKAVAAYEFLMDVETQKVGFVTDDDMTMGCSPDRLVGDDGVLEIKCLSAKVHVETIQYHHKNKKAPPKYYQQSQGQMIVAERSWSDLFFYHPKLPALRIRTTPEGMFTAALLKSVKDVLEVRDDIVNILKEVK